MRTSRKSYFFAFSPVIASASSYLLNVSLIYILNDPTEYARFLSLNSWAVYLGAVAYLLILDLHLGPNRAHYVLEELLSISALAIVLSVSLIGLAAVLSGSRDLLVLVVAVLGFSSFRLSGQYFIFSKHLVGVSTIRYLRAGLILVAILLMIYLRDQVPFSAASQVLLQGAICVVTLVLAQLLFRIVKRTNLAAFRKVIRLDLHRLLTRVFGLLIDTVHIPIFYYLLKNFSNDVPAAFIYALGVVIPAAYVVSTLVREQVLIRDELVEKVMRSRTGPRLVVFYVGALFAGLVLSVWSSTIALFGLAGAVATLVTLAGAVGTVLYRRGLETVDLALDISVFAMLAIIFFLSDTFGATLTIKLAMLCLVFKYVAQMGIAFTSVRFSE